MATEFQSFPGKGVTGKVEGREVVLGQPAFLKERGADPTFLRDIGAAQPGSVLSVIGVLLDRQPAGWIIVSDPLRLSAPQVIQAVMQDGLRVVMATGDRKVSAEAVASSVGITEVYADVLPAEKAKLVQRLQAEGRKVAMVGDGVNDAPALAQADVGLAIGSGSDIAVASAGVTLVKGDLHGLLRARAISRATLRNIKQNLFFAFFYNTLMVPVAAGVFYSHFGILLSPVWASAAMSASSLCVVANALRLRHFRFGSVGGS
jgi:Cu+-exporting ATPase